METVKTRSSYDKNPELIMRYRAGDAQAGEELAILNRPLVYNIAGRFLTATADPEELAEIGTIGLVKAINTFDMSRGCAFSTYAVPIIFGEIRRFLRDDGMIKVSRENKRLSALLNKEKERRAASGEDMSIGAIANAVGISAEDAVNALFSCAPVRSLDECIYDSDSKETLAGTVFDEDEEKKDFDKLALKMAIEKLPERDREIILLRYFKDYSQAETAKILGLTQVKISREEKKILAFLKKELS